MYTCFKVSFHLVKMYTQTNLFITYHSTHFLDRCKLRIPSLFNNKREITKLENQITKKKIQHLIVICNQVYRRKSSVADTKS